MKIYKYLIYFWADQKYGTKNFQWIPGYHFVGLNKDQAEYYGHKWGLTLYWLWFEIEIYRESQ